MNLAASIQERVKGLLPDLMGIEFNDVTPDKVVARLAVRKDLCTVGDSLHGGAIMAFADTLGAVAAILNMPEGSRTTTIESKTNFIGGAPAGTRVVGEAVIVHKGRTTVVCQTTVRSETGKLVALVTQTQLVIAPQTGV
ncbi:MAG: PaaI family thioesterase [Candidatus Parcubacteria bacterium]|nr:PaaI family thioesterase [Burkholderiales bacterium]